MKNAAKRARTCELQNTVIIEISNVNGGPAFSLGLHLFEGRNVYHCLDSWADALRCSDSCGDGLRSRAWKKNFWQGG